MGFTHALLWYPWAIWLPAEGTIRCLKTDGQSTRYYVGWAEVMVVSIFLSVRWLVVCNLTIVLIGRSLEMRRFASEDGLHRTRCFLVLAPTSVAPITTLYARYQSYKLHIAILSPCANEVGLFEG